MVFLTEDHKSVRLDTLKNKIIVLDLWTTNCGVCFKKFPEFEKLHNEYKNNSKVEIYALNIPIPTDTVGHARKKIDSYNYQFQKLYAKSNSLQNMLNFNSYPRLLILKNGKVRFNGHPNTDDLLFINSVKGEIELLLKE